MLCQNVCAPVTLSDDLGGRHGKTSYTFTRAHTHRSAGAARSNLADIPCSGQLLSFCCPGNISAMDERLLFRQIPKTHISFVCFPSLSLSVTHIHTHIQSKDVFTNCLHFSSPNFPQWLWSWSVFGKCRRAEGRLFPWLLRAELVAHIGGNLNPSAK